MTHLKYRHIDYMTTETIQNYINSEDINKIYDAIISAALYGDDYNLAVKLCESFSKHTNVLVRRASNLSLTYILLHFNKLDFNVANSVLAQGKKDIESLVVETAETVNEDLEHNFKGYKFLKKMGYTYIPLYTKDQISLQLESSDSHAIVEAIISASMYGTDYDLALAICEKNIIHPDKNVRTACIYALVYIVFFNFYELDMQVAHSILQKGLIDSNKQIITAAKEIILYLQNTLEGFRFKKDMVT